MKFRVLTVLLLLTLLISAAPVAAQESECEDGFLLIVHDLGETCVLTDVERVVTLEHSMTEAVVTLGVQPVGVADLELYNTLVNLPIPLSEDAIDVGGRREPNLELITTLKPDLIIAASWRVTDNYEQLSAIAPTITFEGSSNIEIMSDYFTAIATALGREAEAEQILEAMYQYFEDSAEVVAEADIEPNFIIAQTWYEDDLATFRLSTDNAMVVEILTNLGLENAWDAEPNLDGFSVVGIETLGEISDTSFFFITDPVSAPFYEESPLWNGLPFVKAGTAYRLSDDLWIYGGPLSAQRIVAAVLESLGLEPVELDFGLEEEEVVEPELDSETDTEAEAELSE